MKDINGILQYKDKEYKLAFNLNVMQAIQKRYGSIEAWGNVTDGQNGEPDVEAVIFGFTEMLNEGIEIDNDEKGTDVKPLTPKQVGRMITEVGMNNALQKLNKTVVDSTQSAEKNE